MASGKACLRVKRVPYLLADKGFHVFMFVILALLLARIFSGPTSVLLIAFFVGVCSEFLQRFFPGRDPAVRDVIINFSGRNRREHPLALYTSRWDPSLEHFG